MQHVEIQTAQNVALRYEVAGVGDRILAVIIDSLLVGTYALLMGLLFIALVSVVDETVIWVLFVVLMLIPIFFYHLICEVFFNGQSIGKRARNIRVIRLDGQEPTLGNYLLRWLLRVVDVGISYGLVGLISILVTKHAQRLGDLAAGTTVVSLAKRRDLRETLFTPVEVDYQIQIPQVDRLTDAEVLLVKDAYALLVAEGVTSRARQVGDDLKRGLEQRMGITAAMTPIQLARTVLRDYNHLHGRIV